MCRIGIGRSRLCPNLPVRPRQTSPIAGAACTAIGSPDARTKQEYILPGARLSSNPLAFRRHRRYTARLAPPVTVGGAIEEQSL